MHLVAAVRQEPSSSSVEGLYLLLEQVYPVLAEELPVAQDQQAGVLVLKAAGLQGVVTPTVVEQKKAVAKMMVGASLLAASSCRPGAVLTAAPFQAALGPGV